VPWYDPLRPVCQEAVDVAKSGADVEVVLFYVARWCQKRTQGDVQPDPAVFDAGVLTDVAAKVVRNLDDDGERVERIVAGDKAAWHELFSLLYGSAYKRVGESAIQYAEEARQKIAWILLTGTPPSRAAEKLANGLEGSEREYVFTSPFSFWTCRVLINMIVDEWRRILKERKGFQPTAPKQQPTPLDRELIRRAFASLPSLFDAIRGLGPVQRSVMVSTLAGGNGDPDLREHLHTLAPDLFSEAGDEELSSDREIAEHLGTTPHLVAANRCAARVKLARRDLLWALLLDALMPHKSTRSADEEGLDG
jgi:hypothetical protein